MLRDYLTRILLEDTVDTRQRAEELEDIFGKALGVLLLPRVWSSKPTVLATDCSCSQKDSTTMQDSRQLLSEHGYELQDYRKPSRPISSTCSL